MIRTLILTLVLGFTAFAAENPFATYGIQNGDTVQKIDTTLVSSPAETMAALQNIHGPATIQVMRNGKPVTIHYDGKSAAPPSTRK